MAMTQKETNDKFVEVMEKLTGLAKENASKSVMSIVNVSKDYLGKETHTSLTQFYEMYFSEDDSITEKKEKLNTQVDDLIDQIQAISGSEESIEAIKNQIDAGDDEERLGYSGLQKQLETLISLEEGLKKKMAPVLHSMQFEDAMRQRIEHTLNGLKQITSSDMKNPETVKEISESIANSLSSDREREPYYRLVMEEEAPAGIQETSIWIDFQ